MGIEMDRRLAERRRRVAEERARSNLGRLLRLLIALGVAGAVVWFMHSPFMSVGRIVVDGARQVDVEAVLAQHGIYEGRPLLFLDVASAEAALLEDPWVAEATVARDWPTTVLVEVVEREPAVAVRLADGWWSAAADGVLLERAEQRPDGLPAADFADVPSEEVAEDLDVAGAIEYLAALPPEYRADALVVSGDEGLEGTAPPVRIGRPTPPAPGDGSHPRTGCRRGVGDNRDGAGQPRRPPAGGGGGDDRWRRRRRGRARDRTLNLYLKVKLSGFTNLSTSCKG